MTWMRVKKSDAASCKLADGHYSRRTVGAPQFMPPGQTVVLLHASKLAVFGWWRPAPSSGIQAMNGLDGWTCTIFRNCGAGLSSALICEAEVELLRAGYGCGPDGLLTYVWDKKVRSSNPGCCFQLAGYRPHPTKPRSADKRKSLWQKPWAMAGILPVRRPIKTFPADEAARVAEFDEAMG